MINVHQLLIKYNTKEVLNIPEFTFDDNKVHGIIGLNGAGKTSFFNALSLFLKPQAGQLTYNGFKIKRDQIGYLETTNYFFSNITGREYLAVFPNNNTVLSATALQELMELPLDTIIESYSTGMKKKLALLAIIQQEKPIYIFDEPFNGLDLETNKLVEVIIQKLNAAGKTIFISSHILSPLLNVCDKIHLLQQKHFTDTFTKDQFHEIDEKLFKGFDDKIAAVFND
jgi:ABC-2 type transport system ATP-binding protein